MSQSGTRGAPYVGYQLRPVVVAPDLDRLQTGQFERYGLTARDIYRLRARFAGWSRDGDDDHEARAAHAAVHRP